MKSIGKDRVRVSVRQQSVLDAEARKLASAERLNKYVECGVFNHEKLAGDFDASGNRMQASRPKSLLKQRYSRIDARQGALMVHVAMRRYQKSRKWISESD